MVTKYILAIFALAIGGSFAQSCQNPQVEAASFTSLDATVVTQIAYITEFTLKCDNPLAENYALYAEVEGKPLIAARIADNKYQVIHTLFIFVNIQSIEIIKHFYCNNCRVSPIFPKSVRLLKYILL